MNSIKRTNKFSKELKLMIKRGKDPEKLITLLEILVDNLTKGISYCPLLPSKYSLHKLSGKYKDRFECHIEPDWLLIYYVDSTMLILERTGTHSDLFE